MVSLLISSRGMCFKTIGGMLSRPEEHLLGRLLKMDAISMVFKNNIVSVLFRGLVERLSLMKDVMGRNMFCTLESTRFLIDVLEL